MNSSRFIRENPICVVDIGASGGLSEPFASRGHCHGILFEPDERAAESLYTVSPSEVGHTYTILTTALGPEKGPLTFYLARDQECSGCLKPNVELLNRFPDPGRFETIKTISLEGDTLDNQLGAKGLEPDFLKLDVQGFESNILDGATTCLASAVGLIIEVEFVPLYSGQRLFSQVHEQMMNAGFELFDLQRSFWKRGIDGKSVNTRGQLVFANALYLRPPDQLRAHFRDRKSKIAAAALIYHAFGYRDALLVVGEAAGNDHFELRTDIMALAEDLAHRGDRLTPSTLIRRKLHGACVRAENFLRFLRKRLLAVDHFGRSDATLGANGH